MLIISVIDKIIESANFIIDENSGMYPQHFPLNPGRDVYVNHSIDSLNSMTNLGIQLQRPIKTISIPSHVPIGDLSSSGSWSNISRPHVPVETNIVPPVDLLDLDLGDFQDSLPSVGELSKQDILANSSIMELADANDEPLDSRFKSIQELLNSTPHLPDYSNFPELPEEPKPPDLFRLDSIINDVVHNSNALLAQAGEALQELQTYREAISSPDSTSWQDAMNHEYASLMENQTWKLVLKPSDRKVVQNKWIYKIKYKPNGDIDKFKARLVAKGFIQKRGLDFTETYSPVIRYDSIRAIFATAAARNMHLRQFNIGIAFLNGDLLEEIYMFQPQGYVDPKHPQHYCRLKKSIYGLRQSARQWNLRI